MLNKIRLTLISFLAYFIMSGILSPIGIILGPMADHFEQPITVISAQFSWLTMGILVGSVIALGIFDWVRLKPLLLTLYGLITLSLVGFTVVEDLWQLGLALALVGVCCGIGLAGAATIISSIYDAERRASALVMTDGSFSIAGVVISAAALFLLARDFDWFGAYLFVAVIAALLLLLLLVSNFHLVDAFTAAPSESTGAVRGRWPMGVWLCIMALFLYTLGQYSLLWWLPNYLETASLAPAARAGEVVGQFWSGMFVAQLLVTWWVLKIGVQRLVIIGSVTTMLFSMPLWLYEDIDGLMILAFIWGVANLGLLKMIISFATLIVRAPTPRLISGLLLGATLGTAVSPWVTSQIVEHSTSYLVLQFGSGCYLALVIALLMASRRYAASQASLSSLSDSTVASPGACADSRIP